MRPKMNRSRDGVRWPRLQMVGYRLPRLSSSSSSSPSPPPSPSYASYPSSSGSRGLLVLIAALLLIASWTCPCSALHLRGEFRTGEFFKLLAKFGFERTDNHDHVNTLGYIYGNVTARRSDRARDDEHTAPAAAPPSAKFRSTKTVRAVLPPVAKVKAGSDSGGSTTSPSSSSASSSSSSLSLSSSSSPSPHPSVTEHNNSTTKSTTSVAAAGATTTRTGLTKTTTTTSAKTATAATTKTAAAATTIKTAAAAATTTRTSTATTTNTKAATTGDVTPKAGTTPHRATLVVVEREHFLALWGNRTRLHDACAAMFSQIQKDAFDRHCNPNGTQDFLRSLPCPVGGLCEDEDTPDRVLKQSQFTYTVRDRRTPRFWYVTLVACYRDHRHNCTWRSSADEDAADADADGRFTTLDYDIHLVNGHPHESTALDDEFSFEEQGSLQRTGIFFALYMFLLALQCHVQLNRERHHPLTRILFMAVLLQFVSHLATLVHIVLFASNGEGLPSLRVVGEVAYIFAQSFFVVLILVISRGYAITRADVSGKRLLVFLWLTYIVAHVVLYVWVNTEIDPIKEIDEFETYPGGLVLAVRMALMLFMLRELRSTMHLENNGRKLRFYLHLAAGMLCWFIYLPILAVIASQVSSLWKQNLVRGIVSCADFLAYAVVTHVLWPTQSHDYLQLEAVFEDDYDDYRRFTK